MSKQPDVYLELALRALERVLRFLADRSLKAYLEDELCQAPELFARIPEGPLIVAFRNVLAHGYATLDHRRVFDAATTKVATLSGAISKLLQEYPEG